MYKAFSKTQAGLPDLLVFSHLRWDFVFQRPQHLMVRHARQRRVFFFEEPLLGAQDPWLEIRASAEGVRVVTPHLPDSDESQRRSQLTRLVTKLVGHEIRPGFTAWYYTPMALPFSRHLHPGQVIYDCMDELSGFKFAPPELQLLEAELMRAAHLVFTGGYSLYQAKKDQHPSIYPFPSSIDAAHFRGARTPIREPDDQAKIPYPRLGFFGVIDERMDLDLVAQVARAHPGWQIVMIGPVVKIDPLQLPREPNIHYLGMKAYADLPAYLSGWNVALMPFALNASTKFISPTKTLEYLAAGRPVVSTSVQDVVSPYGEQKLVRIGDGVAKFSKACELALKQSVNSTRRTTRADRFLAGTSWDITFEQMLTLERNVHRSVTETAAEPAFAEPAI